MEYDYIKFPCLAWQSQALGRLGVEIYKNLFIVWYTGTTLHCAYSLN